MKIREIPYSDNFDLAIFGLGYESRSTFSFKNRFNQCTKKIVVGYSLHTDKFSYKSNKKQFQNEDIKLFEGRDDDVFEFIKNETFNISKTPINVLFDITVMSRHRLATIIIMLIETLPQDSTLTITYTRSHFVEPPTDITPIKKIGEIADKLAGSLGNLSHSTSLIFGLGYEKNKALGVSNFLDSDPNLIYLFIPESPEEKFEELVLKNNEDFIKIVPERNVFKYNACAPYDTYIKLKSLILSLEEFTRPLLIPLGPKILSAISVVIGNELYPNLPVWRASSEQTEEPIERSASGIEVQFTLDINKI